jgi:CheY-like chemotaxis protein
VDDEQQLLNSTARALGLLYQVVTANSGVSAQAILEQDQNFDLILCDMMMPGMTGMELHAWMRTEFPDLAQRTVFVSGGAFTAKAIEYLKEVDNARLDKPYEFEQLTALINRLCRTR